MNRLLLFLLLITPLQSHILNQRLLEAKSGDYTVFEANKMATLLIVRPTPTHTLIFEEITAPLAARPDSWRTWVEQRAPGHTSWSMVEIDPATHEILECYSFSRNAWIDTTAQESLIATLLSLPLTPIPHDQLRRIGPPPLPGEPDHRQLWSPTSSPCTAYETTWPSDGSELANRRVLLYFDQANPFPTWIEVITPHIVAPIRALDAGHHLASPHRTLPRRAPEILSIRTLNRSLHIALRAPRYYRAYELFALDITQPQHKTVIPLSHTLIAPATLTVSPEELAASLEPDHLYNWLILPVGYSDAYVQSNTPYRPEL